MSPRLRSNRSVRRYAASTLLWITCASAASTTYPGWLINHSESLAAGQMSME